MEFTSLGLPTLREIFMQNQPDDVLVRLVHELTSWSSLDMYVVTSQIDHLGGDPAIKMNPADGTIRQRYKETSKRQRMLDETNQFVIDGKLDRTQSFRDGKKSANIRFSGTDPQRQRTIVIEDPFSREASHGATNRPKPLLYDYVGKVPLYEAMQGAVWLGMDERIGRSCDRYQLSKIQWSPQLQTSVYWLDHATSVPVEIAAYPDQAAYEASKPTWIWKAKTLDDVQGYHFPLHSADETYRIGADGTRVLQFSSSINVESLKYNQKLPDSDFWPVFDPGVEVWDTYANKVYHTPTAKGEVKPPATPAAKVTTAPPIRVEPDADSSWIAGGSLVVGLAVIVASVMLWWRRR